ncbi:MAG: hypothetical protein GY741_03485 [Phycisphaeraceae bacterium]|nr:hypothetical protein [Phycisphaeraceae bacterium]
MSDQQENPDYRVQMDDPEPGATWFLSLVSLVLMVVVVLAAVAMYFGFAEGEIDRKIVDRPTVELQKLRLSQQEQLTEYQRYEIEDAEGNKVERIRIPVTRAMELVVADSRASAETDEEGAVARR